TQTASTHPELQSSATRILMLSTGAISAGTEKRSILSHNAASTVAGRVSAVSGRPDFTVIESSQELHRTSLTLNTSTTALARQQRLCGELRRWSSPRAGAWA